MIKKTVHETSSDDLSIPSWNEIVEHMRDKQLTCFADEVVKVIYSEDGERRIVVLQSEKGFFKTCVEVIRVFDKEEWIYFCKDKDAYPAWWETDWEFDTKSLYDSVQTALKELKVNNEYKYNMYFEMKK